MTETIEAERPKTRPNGLPLVAVHGEVGLLTGYGALRIHTLHTADALADVLDERYFAVAAASGFEIGDLLIAVTGFDGEADSAQLTIALVDAVNPLPGPGRLAPKRVLLRVLQTWGGDK